MEIHWEAVYCLAYATYAAYDAPKKFSSKAVEIVVRYLMRTYKVPHRAMRASAIMKKRLAAKSIAWMPMKEIIKSFSLQKILDGEEKGRILWPWQGREVTLGFDAGIKVREFLVRGNEIHKLYRTPLEDFALLLCFDVGGWANFIDLLMGKKNEKGARAGYGDADQILLNFRERFGKKTTKPNKFLSWLMLYKSPLP
eukprot:8450800-Karenia_brevis.AAC.1